MAANDDTCPGCGGPITYSPGDKDGITVYFHCANTECDYGKHPGPDERVVASSESEVPA